MHFRSTATEVYLGVRKLIRCSDLTRDNALHFGRRTADLRFLPNRLAFALTVRSAGFNAAATTAVAACDVFFPVRALDAIRIVSVCAATVPEVAAANFSDTIRFNSAPSLDVIPAAKRIGHRHHSVMLVSRIAAPRSAANWSGVCRCAMWVKLRSGMFVPYDGDAGPLLPPDTNFAAALPKSRFAGAICFKMKAIYPFAFNVGAKMAQLIFIAAVLNVAPNG